MLGSKDGALVKWTPESGWVCMAHSVLPKPQVLDAMRFALRVYASRRLPMGERGDKMRAAVAQLGRMVNANEAVAVIAFPPSKGAEVSLLSANAGYEARPMVYGGLN